MTLLGDQIEGHQNAEKCHLSGISYPTTRMPLLQIQAQNTIFSQPKVIWFKKEKVSQKI